LPISYNIRREKGLVRDPKTGKVGPNRTADMRYTELADEMVVNFGRVGQKAQKVSGPKVMHASNILSVQSSSIYPFLSRAGTITIRKLARAASLCHLLKCKS
jgi:archaellum component FlaF (FlaF/FlaG flagellin family)